MGTIRIFLRIILIIFVALFAADLTAYSMETRPLPTELVWDYVVEPVVAFYRWIGEGIAFFYRFVTEILRNLLSHVFDAFYNSAGIVLRVFFPLYDILMGFLIRLQQYSEELIAQGVHPFWRINVPTTSSVIFFNAVGLGAFIYNRYARRGADEAE